MKQLTFFVFVTGLIVGFAYTSSAQDATLINPRYSVTEPPSAYPLGLYLMNSEYTDPYNWLFDAGVILGLKPASSNYRHVQLIIDNDSNRMAMRSKNATTDQWLGWDHVAMREWVDDNFPKIQDENLGIGVSDPTTKLAVNGTAKAKEVVVTEEASDWPDYVFLDSGYRILDLAELEKFIEANNHLPGIPTKDEIIQGGQNLGAIQAKLLQKIEELTLYVIELKEENDAQQIHINKQQKLLQLQQKKLNKFKLNRKEK